VKKIAIFLLLVSLLIPLVLASAQDGLPGTAIGTCWQTDIDNYFGFIILKPETGTIDYRQLIGSQHYYVLGNPATEFITDRDLMVQILNVEGFSIWEEGYDTSRAMSSETIFNVAMLTRFGLRIMHFKAKDNLYFAFPLIENRIFGIAELGGFKLPMDLMGWAVLQRVGIAQEDELPAAYSHHPCGAYEINRASISFLEKLTEPQIGF
jgi:hypothetical protein